MATTISELQDMMKDHLRGQQEDRIRFQEIERRLTQQAEEDRVRFQETDRFLKQQAQEDRVRFQEMERLLNQKFQETDQKFQENQRILDKQFKETDRRVREAFELFTSQWGKLIESLVEGDLIRILNERGIPVTDTIKRREGKRGGENYELDIIAINGVEIVIVEVKTT